MSENSEYQQPFAPVQDVIVCANCRSTMPAELRFCRNCGFRLGEGSAEYTVTERFDGTQVPAGAPATSMPVRRKRRKMSGIAWIFVALLVFFVGAAAFTAMVAPFHPRRGGIVSPAPAKSYVGVNGFDTVDDDAGVTFQSVDAPDGPADKAGLIGGDIITSFDGQPIHDEDQMSDLMKSTPIGKTVDIEYLRDGEKKATKLTTIDQGEFNRLTKLFKQRPEGIGQFGFDSGETEIVEIQGTKIHGVQLNKILSSRPADLAGIKNGDIVIEFDHKPIRTTEEFGMRVKRALPYSTVDVVVMRGDEKLTIPVKIGKV
jgi:membrane-associated protease RseP (regulator of RpoE activity)